MAVAAATRPLLNSILAGRQRKARRRIMDLARVTRSLYASREPFAPYRTVNAVQRALPVVLPGAMRLLLPGDLMKPAGLRASQIIQANANASLVQEAMLLWGAPHHHARLCVPPSAWRAWPGRVNRVRSLVSFAMFLIAQLRQGVRRVGQLARYGADGAQVPAEPFVVAVNVPQNAVDFASGGGVLFWLRRSPLLPSPVSTIVVASKFVKRTLTRSSADTAIVGEAFAPVRSRAGRVAFAVSGYTTVVAAALLALAGQWQALALLPDIIEVQYVRRVDQRDIAQLYAFFLGDQARRPLWTFAVNGRGARTPLIFYASSYTMFAYDAPAVPDDVRNPVVLMNIWDECWFQTEAAARSVSHLVGRAVDVRITGPFDVVDDDRPLPKLGARTLAIFDIEPTASALHWTMAGYILPAMTEARIVEFWRVLLAAARRHDLVLVHKPKRVAFLQREWQYRALLAEAAGEGRYVELTPDTGPLRVMAGTRASVVLPFTSVGDLAISTGSEAVFFDAAGSISDAAVHANGLPVLAGDVALDRWLTATFDEAKAPGMASARS